MTDFSEEFLDVRTILNVLITAPPATLSDGTETFYTVGEKIFGATAVRMRNLGWTTFPQERDDRRMPSKIDGRALKWSTWYDNGPTVDETARWSAQASNANTAIILGPASGNTFCFDIDIMDEDLSLDIQGLAKSILGETPFRRVGQEPKIALFYRTLASELPRNRQIVFAPQVVDNGVQAIEILARGKAITSFGYHHKTGRYFGWLASQPTYFGPEHAPLVSPAKIDEFIEACGKLRPFVQARRSVVAAGAGFDGALQVSGDWIIPPNRSAVTLNEAGLVDGHRETWLKDMAYDLVRMNPGRVAISDGGDGWIFSQSGVDQAVQVLLDVAAERMTTVGWRKSLRDEIVGKIERSARSLCEGQIKHLPRARKIGSKLYTQNKLTLAAVPEAAVSILPPRDKRRPLDVAAISPVDAGKAQERALKLDRAETAKSVSEQVDGAYEAFFAEVYSNETKRKEVHALKAPTGAGKSSRSASYIVSDPRTYAEDDLPAGSDDRQGPLLFLLPTYQNINELRERAESLGLDAAASDEQLAQDAQDLGLVSPDDVDAEIERIKAEAGSKLKTMVYKGKIAAGCQQEAKMRLVLDAGISSSSLCKGRKKIMGGWEDVLCPFYAGCDAIKQRSEIAKSHLVFLPHSFMSLTIPEELQNTRGVIADERVFTLFVHTARLKLANLQRPRKEPKLSKKETDKLKLHPQEFLDDRLQAAEIATRELLAGRDPAAALAEYQEQAPKRMITGLSLVKSAARVCGGASSVNVAVHSDMSEDEIATICAQPTGEEVGQEYRFWKIMQERIEALEKGTSKHDRENRIQLLRHLDADGNVVPMIRISWMTEPNWPAAPVLLLDASAHAGIIGKIFPDRTVVMHDIEADLNLKVFAVIDKSYSTASLVPHAEASERAILQAARRIDLYRDARNNICAWHGNGRVLETSMKSVREMNSTDYVPPVNLDQIHLGAERGLDFAKQHVASIGLGRMELPVWIMDGLAAALAATDPEPAALLDPLGNGCLPDGNPLPQAVGEITLPMRDGRDVTIVAAKNPVGWQRIVQEQFREEGLRQGAIGRMRPVYREDTPTVYLFATCIPEGIIVDEICSLMDLVPSYAPLLEAARWNGGVIDWLLSTSTRGDLASRAQFKDQFKDLPAELKAGYTTVRYEVDGVGVLAGVPSVIEDPVGHLKDQMERNKFKIDGEPVIVRQAEKARVAPAGERQPDAVEIALGLTDDRRLAEQTAREEALQSLSSYEPGKGRYPIGTAIDAKGKRVSLSLTAMALLKRAETTDLGADQQVSEACGSLTIHS